LDPDRAEIHKQLYTPERSLSSTKSARSGASVDLTLPGSDGRVRGDAAA
jgi:hypothetical protein